MMSKLSSFFVVPGYTFFYYGFTLQKAVYSEYIKFFGLNEKTKFKSITLLIAGKKYKAKIRIARINNKGTIKTRSDTIYPERDVVQIFYDKEAFLNPWLNLVEEGYSLGFSNRLNALYFDLNIFSGFKRSEDWFLKPNYYFQIATLQ